MALHQYIGARYVPAFYNNSDNTAEWRSGVEYEPLTIVTYNGNSYTSKRLVPSYIGNPSSATEYWVSTGNYNAQIEHLTNLIEAMPFVYPEDFGAVGDGVTDDTDAFTSMFLSGSNIFILKDKTYKVSSAISVPYTCTIIGQGTATIFQTTKRANIFNLMEDDTTVNNVIFKSTGQGFAGEAVEGAGTMILAYGERTTLINCSFVDANYVGVYIYASAHYSNVIDCYFENCWAEGLSYQANNGSIDNCGFYSCKYNGVVLRGCDGVEVTNCKFIDCSVTDVAIDFHKHHDTTEYAKNCVVSDCIIDNAYIAISMVGSDWDNNYFENIVIKNNVIRNGRAGGNMSVRCYYTKDIIIDGNIIEDAGDVYSILLSSCKDAAVINNIFKRTAQGTTALYTSTRGLKVENNTFRNYTVGAHITSGSSPFDWWYIVSGNVFESVVTGIKHEGNYAKAIEVNGNMFTDGTTDMNLAGGAGTLIVCNNILHGTFTKTIATQAYIQNGNSPLDRPDMNSTSLGAGAFRGQMYFAPDLGLPVFYNGSAWVKADGTAI